MQPAPGCRASQSPAPQCGGDCPAGAIAGRTRPARIATAGHHRPVLAEPGAEVRRRLPAEPGMFHDSRDHFLRLSGRRHSVRPESGAFVRRCLPGGLDVPVGSRDRQVRLRGRAVACGQSQRPGAAESVLSAWRAAEHRGAVRLRAAAGLQPGHGPAVRRRLPDQSGVRQIPGTTLCGCQDIAIPVPRVRPHCAGASARPARSAIGRNRRPVQLRGRTGSVLAEPVPAVRRGLPHGFRLRSRPDGTLLLHSASDAVQPEPGSAVRRRLPDGPDLPDRHDGHALRLRGHRPALLADLGPAVRRRLPAGPGLPDDSRHHVLRLPGHHGHLRPEPGPAVRRRLPGQHGVPHQHGHRQVRLRGRTYTLRADRGAAVRRRLSRGLHVHSRCRGIVQLQAASDNLRHEHVAAVRRRLPDEHALPAECGHRRMRVRGHRGPMLPDFGAAMRRRLSDRRGLRADPWHDAVRLSRRSAPVRPEPGSDLRGLPGQPEMPSECGQRGVRLRRCPDPVLAGHGAPLRRLLPVGLDLSARYDGSVRVQPYADDLRAEHRAAVRRHLPHRPGVPVEPADRALRVLRRRSRRAATATTRSAAGNARRTKSVRGSPARPSAGARSIELPCPQSPAPACGGLCPGGTLPGLHEDRAVCLHRSRGPVLPESRTAVRRGLRDEPGLHDRAGLDPVRLHGHRRGLWRQHAAAVRRVLPAGPAMLSPTRPAVSASSRRSRARTPARPCATAPARPTWGA